MFLETNTLKQKNAKGGNRSCFLPKALLTQFIITYEQGHTRKLLNKVP